MMKTIGLLGGMSWESTALYYQELNKRINSRLGGLHSAKIILSSLDFYEIEKLQSEGNWSAAEKILVKAAQQVEQAGADCLLICTNTMHKLADAISASLRIPLLHIADATAKCLSLRKIERAGLLGTKFTMEQDFYRGRVLSHGISIEVPNEEERKLVHSVIYDELCRGIVTETSKNAYLNIVDGFISRGCQGVILGCTEIGMLIKDGERHIPFFDTMSIHVDAAVEFSLSL